jgi:uncharacterized membrane protein
MLANVRAPRSRIASTVTLLFLVGGALVVVLAVVAVARDVRDDAAWAAIVLGVALAAWGVWFHRLTDTDTDTDTDAADADPATEPDRAPTARSGPLGTAAVAGVIVAGGYWLLRGPLDRGVAESAVVTAITLGLWLLNRSLDVRIRRRRADEVDRTS